MNYIFEFEDVLFSDRLPVVFYWTEDWDEDRPDDWSCNECLWFPLGWRE